MNPQDIRALHILEEIEKGNVLSQRYLARELDVSLGLVNSFIKQLAQEGYFKISYLPKNRIKYILTPEGAVEKTRLTYEYIQYSFQLYKAARCKVRVLFQDLMNQGVNHVVFYGASDIAELAYISLLETPLEMVAVVDDLRVGEKFLGAVITDPEELCLLSFDRIFITAVDSREAVIERILGHGICRTRIAMLE